MTPMMIRNTLRMEAACFVILAFIAFVYFSAKRPKTRLHKVFSCLIVSLEIHLLFDAVTVYTVNNLDEVPKWLNDICHRIFVGTMLLTILLYYLYIVFMIDEETNHRKRSVLYNVIRHAINIYMVAAEILIFIAPVEYQECPKGNYEIGVAAVIIYISIPMFLFHIVANIIRNYKYIHPKKRMAVIMVIIIEIITTIITAIDMSMLIAGLGLTLEAVCFYVILENPDIKLVEQIRSEKHKVEKISESKSKFVSVVSHEIRTPMNAIVGMTELMLNKSTNLDDEQIKYLTNIKNSGDALITILNDLLDMSKLEAGKFEIVEQPYSTEPFFEDIRMIIENRIGDKPIKLIYDIDDSMPEKLNGDSLRLRQVLINLMNNAVKFTDSGEIRLTIKIIKNENDRYSISFSVRDTGIGVKKEDLSRLFQAFTQVDLKKNQGKEGTGMGLSISSDLISLMGGKLSVASEYGKWTEFSFTISQGAAQETEAAKDTDSFEEIKGIHVLVVDDTDINLEIAKEIFEMLGVYADTAESGQDAIEMLFENKYDIIFTDYIMPEMSGTEFAVKVREYIEEGAEIPIIALTGDVSENAINEFNKSGINDYIQKPINVNKLALITKKWIKNNT